MSDYGRIERAFLAAGIDPEFSAVIHAYNTNPYVHALVHKLADYIEELSTGEDHFIKFNSDGWTIQHPLRERIDGTLFDCYLTWDGGDLGLRGVYHLLDSMEITECADDNCRTCTRRHNDQ